MGGFKEKYLKKGSEPYFIAEIGINHSGLFDLAKRMIDDSKKAGADGVKFQKRDFSALLHPDVEVPNPNGYLSKDENDFPDETKVFGTWAYPDKRLELSDEEILDLWKYAETIGLDFIVSPWENNSVDFLVKNGAKCLKLASIDTTNYMFCEYIASKGVPTIVSTGMTNYHQQSIVWDIFQKAKCSMMFLHCTSAYPSPLEDKNLRCIFLMKEMFGCDIGFSGHAIDMEGTLGAVALGANVIEKHVTLSRNMSGPDHAAALEFAEFADLVTKARNMVVALGTGRKSFLDSEKTLHGVLCRKIVLKKNINKGSKISKDDLTTFVTNKEGGVLPEAYYEVVGAIAQKDLVKNQILEIVDYK
mgnify:CR=1 FL=1